MKYINKIIISAVLFSGVANAVNTVTVDLAENLYTTRRFANADAVGHSCSIYTLNTHEFSGGCESRAGQKSIIYIPVVDVITNKRVARLKFSNPEVGSGYVEYQTYIPETNDSYDPETRCTTTGKDLKCVDSNILDITYADISDTRTGNKVYLILKQANTYDPFKPLHP